MGRKHEAGMRGPAGFEAFYGELFEGRWPDLKTALLADPSRVALETGLIQPYYLDAASLLVALALDVRPGQEALDLCAAPGGKTLVAALCLDGNGSLTANERSASRRGRLHRVISQHLGPRLGSVVRVTGHDASRWALYEPESYDRVIADVPCSSERHLMHSASDMAKWSPSRTRNLSQGAYAIACAAIDALKPGGRLVYSTCALSPRENDDVVERVLARGSGRRSGAPRCMKAETRVASILEGAAISEAGALQSLQAEATEFGANILPDRNNGAGPMYFAVLTK